MRDLPLPGWTLGFPRSLIPPFLAAIASTAWWLSGARAGWTTTLLLVAFGLAQWTLLEYLLHRFVLHAVEPFRAWHREHHLEPDVPIRIPIAFSLGLILPILLLPAIVLGDAAHAAPLSVGLLAGHAAQETAHHLIHRSRGGGAWLAARRREHLFHHDVGEGSAYGTLTGFWDRLFGTAIDR